MSRSFIVPWPVVGLIAALFLLLVAAAVISLILRLRTRRGDRVEEREIPWTEPPAGPVDGGAPEANFCPYCGVKITEAYQFCGSCGREMPKIEE